MVPGFLVILIMNYLVVRTLLSYPFNKMEYTINLGGTSLNKSNMI